MTVQYPHYIGEIINRLQSNGEKAYTVGGSVRDTLLGKVPNDYDIATSALPQRTAEIFSDKHVIETGLKHGTVTVVFDGVPVEITTFRTDGSYTDKRHPDSVSFTRDICLDLSRRDFTVNAMAYNVQEGLIDPFGGKNDARRRLIRAVGIPEQRFAEDALRIMRAFRFSAQLDFEIDKETLEGACKTANGLELVARERIGNEFLRLICSKEPQNALILMREHGILKYALGAYTPSDNVINGIRKMPDAPSARLGLLLCEKDSESAREILHGLRCSGKQITGALATARGAHLTLKNATDARRLIASAGIYAADAALVSELCGSSPAGAHRLVSEQQGTPCTIHDLKINGKDIAALGARGKQIGITLEYLLKAVIMSPALNERDSLLEAAKNFLGGNNGTDKGETI